MVNLFQYFNDFGIRARTSDSIIGTLLVLALLMNRDTMISVLCIALCSTF